MFAMYFYALDVFSITQYIKHPISLAAFAIAALMTYFIARNANERRKIQSAKPADRATLMIKTAERLHLDITSVPAKERAMLIRQVLRNRIISQILIASVVLILGLLTSYLVNKTISSQLQNANNTTRDTLSASIPAIKDSGRIGESSLMSKREGGTTTTREGGDLINKNVVKDSINAKYVQSYYYNGHEYLIYKLDKKVNWESINNFISEIGGGVYMLTITTSDENSWLLQHVFNRLYCTGNLPLGLVYQAKTGKFENIYGENQNDFFYWEDGQPDNDFTKERYVHVVEKGNSRSRRWNNIAVLNLPGYDQQRISFGRIFSSFIVERNRRVSSN